MRHKKVDVLSLEQLKDNLELTGEILQDGKYMDNTKNDHYYLDKIKTDLAFIVAHMKDVDAQELNDNEGW